MPFPRVIIGILALTLASLGLTAFWNSFNAIIFDFASNLYYTGLITVAGSLIIHTFIIRRLFRRSILFCRLLGIGISGITAILVHSALLRVTARLTYIQREGSPINFGDDGRTTGLGNYAMRVDWPSFFANIPSGLVMAAISSLLWFPCLLILEWWVFLDYDSKTSKN
jgi:hypothetical protein